jgi:hypothetical protein
VLDDKSVWHPARSADPGDLVTTQSHQAIPYSRYSLSLSPPALSLSFLSVPGMQSRALIILGKHSPQSYTSAFGVFERGSPCVTQAGLELSPSVSASPGLGLQVCTITPGPKAVIFDVALPPQCPEPILTSPVGRPTIFSGCRLAKGPAHLLCRQQKSEGGVSFEGRSLQLKVFQAGCYSLWTTLVKALVLTTLLESWLGGPLA